MNSAHSSPGVSLFPNSIFDDGFRFQDHVTLHFQHGRARAVARAARHDQPLAHAYRSLAAHDVLPSSTAASDRRRRRRRGHYSHDKDALAGTHRRWACRLHAAYPRPSHAATSMPPTMYPRPSHAAASTCACTCKCIHMLPRRPHHTPRDHAQPLTPPTLRQPPRSLARAQAPLPQHDAALGVDDARERRAAHPLAGPSSTPAHLPIDVVQRCISPRPVAHPVACSTCNADQPPGAPVRRRAAA